MSFLFDFIIGCVVCNLRVPVWFLGDNVVSFLQTGPVSVRQNISVRCHTFRSCADHDTTVVVEIILTDGSHWATSIVAETILIPNQTTNPPFSYPCHV